MRVGAYSAPLPNLPAAKFASQCDVHMRTDAQIKFLYYPLYMYCKKRLRLTKPPNVLIKSLFLCLLFTRAEWEGDQMKWPEALKKWYHFSLKQVMWIMQGWIVISLQHGSIARQCPLPLHEREAHFPDFCYSMVRNMVICGNWGVIHLNQ